MKPLASAVIAALLVFWTQPSLSQSKACSAPHAQKIGIVTAHDESSFTANPVLLDTIKRRYAAEVKMRDGLISALPSTACIITDPGTFTDAHNFPKLKGTLIFTVSAMPAFTDNGIYAISTTVITAAAPERRSGNFVVTITSLIQNVDDYENAIEQVMGDLDVRAALYSSQNAIR